MEMIMTLGSTLMSSAAGAAGAAGGASAGASALGSLSGGMSSIGGLMHMGSGILGLGQGLAQAESQRFQGAYDVLVGEERVADIKESFARSSANAMVAAAASGLDISAGQPVDAANAAKVEADKAIGIEREQAALRRYLRQRQALQSEIGGVSSLFKEFGAAAKDFGSQALSVARRGLPQAA